MHYHWSNPNSFIKDIEVFAPHKQDEALVYAPKNASPEDLWKLADGIRAKGYSAESDTKDGLAVLRVTGFPSRRALIYTLEQQEAVAGEATTQKTDLDKEQGFELNRLQIGAAMQVFADGLVIAKAGSRGVAGLHDVAASAQWATAFLIVALFGAKNPDKQTDYIYSDILKALSKSDYDISKEDLDSLGVLAEKNGMLPKLERMIRENPILINSLIQATGGASTIAAGVSQTDYNDKVNWWKIAGGTLTASGNITGGILLDPANEVPFNESIKDHVKNNYMADDGSVRAGPFGNFHRHMPTTAEEKENNGTAGGLAGKLQDKLDKKPLFITGWFSFFSNVSRAISGWQEKKKYNKFMGDIEKGFKGGEWEKKRTDFLSRFEKAIENDKNVTVKNVMKDIFNDMEGKVLEANGVDKMNFTKGLSPEKLKAIEKYHPFIKERKGLRATFNKVANTKTAAGVDTASNLIKMVANIIISTADSKIDADLVETGHLDEITNFLAHIVSDQPLEKQESSIIGLAKMLISQDGINVSVEDVTNKITQKLSAIQNNPWDRKDISSNIDLSSPAANDSNHKQISPATQVHDVRDNHPAMLAENISNTVH